MRRSQSLDSMKHCFTSQSIPLSRCFWIPGMQKHFRKKPRSLLTVRPLPDFRSTWIFQQNPWSFFTMSWHRTILCQWVWHRGPIGMVFFREQENPSSTVRNFIWENGKNVPSEIWRTLFPLLFIIREMPIRLTLPFIPPQISWRKCWKGIWLWTAAFLTLSMKEMPLWHLLINPGRVSIFWITRLLKIPLWLPTVSLKGRSSTRRFMQDFTISASPAGSW